MSKLEFDEIKEILKEALDESKTLTDAFETVCNLCYKKGFEDAAIFSLSDAEINDVAEELAYDIENNMITLAKDTISDIEKIKETVSNSHLNYTSAEVVYIIDSIISSIDKRFNKEKNIDE